MYSIRDSLPFDLCVIMEEHSFETSLDDIAPLQTAPPPWCRRYGNCYGFFLDSKAEPLLTIGPHCSS